MIDENSLMTRTYKTWFVIIGLLLLFLCFFILIVQPVAGMNITLAEKGENYITWSYNSPNVSNIVSIDGIIQTNADIFAKKFSAYNLQSNTSHTIIITSYNTTNATTNYIYDTQTTSPHTNTSTENISLTFYIYFFFFVAIIIILIGNYVPFIGFLGSGFAILGLLASIDISIMTGFIFMVIFCAGIFVGFKGGQ